MRATLGRTTPSEETILDDELLASGFGVDASEALSVLLGGTVLSAGGYAKGRFTRETFHGQTKLPPETRCSFWSRASSGALTTH